MNTEDNKLHQEIAAGERWLTSFAAPRPSPQAIERTKLAVRAELARSPSPVSARRWTAWRGVLGAAATIALAATVSLYSVRTHQFAGRPTETESVDPWIPEAEDEAGRLALLDEDLSILEEWSASQQWSVGSSLYEALQGALENSGGENGETGVMRPLSEEQRAVQSTA